MPRIYMPPRTISLNGKHTHCMVFGETLEVEIDKTGVLNIDDPKFFTTPFVNGTYPESTVLGPYSAVANDTETCFHFTVSANGNEYDVELKVRTGCP